MEENIRQSNDFGCGERAAGNETENWCGTCSCEDNN